MTRILFFIYLFILLVWNVNRINTIWTIDRKWDQGITSSRILLSFSFMIFFFVYFTFWSLRNWQNRIFFTDQLSKNDDCNALGSKGKCILLKNCYSLRESLKTTPRQRRIVFEMIRKLQCGFVGHQSKVFNNRIILWFSESFFLKICLWEKNMNMLFLCGF